MTAIIKNTAIPFRNEAKCFFGLEYNSFRFFVPVKRTLLEFLHHNISMTRKSKALRLCPKIIRFVKLALNPSSFTNKPKIKRTMPKTTIFDTNDTKDEAVLILDCRTGF